MESQRPAGNQNGPNPADRRQYSSQMHSSHHCKQGDDEIVTVVRESMCIKRTISFVIVDRPECMSRAEWVNGINYLQPASLSRFAYIFPMSPMPMIPTTKPSIPGGISVPVGVDAILFSFARSEERVSATERRETCDSSSVPTTTI